jgi:YHS domain-containing protein
MRTRRYLASFLLAALTLGCAEPPGLDPVNRTAAGLALKGYDPVAHFTEKKAVPGSERHRHTWNGARWYFASGDNRDSFARNPERFAPRYGGYCAYAVSHGYTADGDPHAWKIVDGVLYLNYSLDVQRLWEGDIPGNISKGNENRPKFLKRRPEHKG